ncbi:hypothetical protein F3Y22_tig00110556pilonHSYRG00912 [Hibiscus syriacus]|uniref:Clp R domain-containing protein n=1 Tax=Hibiscus syriacus TaxID=106335 RepID=A0A6A3A8V2_HIBSY|nr:protein SMAX1-LIKE 6-like [Hibiscus syriacus]XP_039004543.1 protein SMAX1-LIKE 6-like [Hibiscus syriacus]KAE8700881.1 hypothetical protein F3Y22_tig00110556pilonHSYRG00912 [Hibiscus syriacus]
MPTSVTAARQFLTEETASALDEAVAVARRRSHAQTTSLHAVSALLSLPSSTLREACTRARSSAYPSRLQFRALELSVGVSLDRLPSSKSDEDPPISNSLMAAIKRSQASQRRHPESYHLQQLHSSNNSNAIATGCSQAQAILKVELKYLILSILDDPIVSRVFGEAGFRSCDIKLALVRPPVTQVSSRFSRAHCPPIFLCNLTDSVSGRVGYNLLFPGQEDGVDENCKRISEVMAKNSGKSPLLVGVCAIEALRAFTESLTKGKSGILDGDLAGLIVISIEKEINEIVNEGNEEKMGLKLKEVEATLEKCNGSGGGGVVLHFGDLKGLIFDGALGDFVSPLVLRLASLMEVYRRRLWLMGAVDSVEIYRKFCDKFPNVEKDWDLQLLPITSSKSSFDGAYPKSSLMRSFVPFGGLFPTPSDLKSPLSGWNQSIPRCNLCNEKYEQEVDALKKAGSAVSVADQYSENLPSWLRMAAVDTGKGEDVAKTKAGESMLSAKVFGLQKKWNDICQRVHCTPTFTKSDINPSMSQVPIVKGPQFSMDQKQTSNGDLSINESLFPNQSPGRQIHMQTNFLPKSTPSISCTSEGRNMNFHSVLHVDVPSVTQQTDKDVPWFHHPQQSLSSCSGRTPSSFVPPVTTDLKLGTIYASTTQESKTTKSLNHREHLQRFSGSVSTEFDANSEVTSYQFAQSSSCSVPSSGEQFDLGDYKSIKKALAEKVGWQDEAVNSVSQAVSQVRHKYRSFRGINCKGDNWLTFLGPDRVGKKRIASALADVLFGSQECLVSLDLSSQGKLGHPNSIFECKELNRHDEMSRGKTVSDLIAEELRKKPHSVVFLENVDKADYGVQHSLDLAIRTGKFPDSHGREISINNMVLITTSSSITKGNVNVICGNKDVKFPERRILGAKNWQMQILVGSASDDAGKSNYMGVRVTTVKEASTFTSANKRKTRNAVESSELEKTDTGEREHKVPRSCLDLNFPVEEADEEDMGLGLSKSESSESSENWWEELFSQVYKKIHFKPFDFDEVADKIVKEISSQCQRTVGTEVALEIDEEVMVQMLAAAWLSDKKEAIEDWVAEVLGRSLAEAGQKYNLTPQSVLKLVAYKGDVVKEQAPGIRLPAKINLN